MPFGKKDTSVGQVIDFDQVYLRLIKPAVEDAGLEPLRADEEVNGGIIHKPMFERLVLCDYAVADLTTANANVFYELGVRHAVKPRTTVLMFAEGHGRLPFDVAQLRALPYSLSKSGRPSKVKGVTKSLSSRLKSARKAVDQDSPLFQLLDGYPDIAHERTDVFRDRVAYNREVKEQLATARGDADASAILNVQLGLGNLREHEAGVLVDLLLSYRALSEWQSMLDLVAQVDEAVASTVLFQEQLAFAQNRLGLRRDAERTLKGVLSSHGPSSETYGLLGRVYKDRWLDERKAGQDAAARGWLDKAILAYRNGLRADFRDAYPGINFLTLRYIKDGSLTDVNDLAAVVQFAVNQRFEGSEPDYWDWATKLELAALRQNVLDMEAMLAGTLAATREGWELLTTANNLELIAESTADIGFRARLMNVVERLQAHEKSLKGN